jgi:mannose-6-phosphate isomerase-like protein (cupin superfamily)
MNSTNKSLPIKILSPSNPSDDPLHLLLGPNFSEQFSLNDGLNQNTKSNLLNRVKQSVASASDKVLTRFSRVRSTVINADVHIRILYASESKQLRQGEPLKTSVITLGPGAEFNIDQTQGLLDASDTHREWLIVSGEIELDHERLTTRDYKIIPAGFKVEHCQSKTGASIYVRESTVVARSEDTPQTIRDSSDFWPEFAPGIRRRVLWQRDGQAAMLYLTEPNAQVPHHSHHHDEECFMVQGELYLDDTLLQEGDFQLAKGGSQHHVTRTDTGVVLYAHGDFELRFIP